MLPPVVVPPVVPVEPAPPELPVVPEVARVPPEVVVVPGPDPALVATTAEPVDEAAVSGGAVLSVQAPQIKAARSPET